MIFQLTRRQMLLACLCFLFAILWLPAAAAAREGADQLFLQGNEDYSRGSYEEAIASYAELLDQAGWSAPVLYNLANSYARAGKIGMAVLNYERALRLAPGDADIAGNLELVRKENGLFAGESSLNDKFFRLLNPDQWALLVLLGLVLFTLFRLAALRVRFSGRISGPVAALCLFLLILGSVGTLVRHRHFNPAVVVAPDGRLLISPFASAASVGAVQEGRLVYPDREHGEFVHVTDETGRKGWLARKTIAHVVL